MTSNDRALSELANIGQLLAWRVAASPDREAFRFRDPEENWVSLTWAETWERVRTFAAALLALGLRPE